MATNDFLPFAVGAGANVLSQSDYAAMPALPIGYGAGIAKSVQVNKTLRQSSIMAAVLAQFIANQTGANSVDDGTTATLLTNLWAAVKTATNTVVGTVRNLVMNVPASSAAAALTADEIVVESALGGLTYKIPSFSKTINISTTGAGGMDTGTATANGFLAIYAIYNPTTGTSALLGVNAAGGVRTNVYSGANMPAGYTASALLAVVPLTSGSLIAAGVVNDRRFSWGGSNLATGLTNGGVYTALSIAGSVPPNARRISGTLQAGSSVAGAYINLTVAANTAGFGSQTMGVYTQSGIPFIQNYAIDLAAVQSMAYSFNCNSGTPSTTLTVTSYEI